MPPKRFVLRPGPDPTPGTPDAGATLSPGFGAGGAGSGRCGHQTLTAASPPEDDAPSPAAAAPAVLQAAVRRRRTATAAEAAAKASGLLHYEHMPLHLKDNSHIHSFYRPVVSTHRAALASLFRLHNESGNVWSHLLGFILFAVLAVTLYARTPMPLDAARLHGLIATGGNGGGGVGGSLVGAAGHAAASPSSGPLAAAIRAEHAAAAALAGAASRLAAALRAHHHPVAGAREPLLTLTPRPPARVVTVAATPPPALAAALKSAEHALASRRTGGAAAAAAHAAGGAARRAAAGLARELAALEAALARAARAARAGAKTEVLALEAAASRAARTALGAAWPAPRWPVLVFFAGAMTCLGASATCHLLACLPAPVATAIWRFDYAGIVALIVASFFPAVHYGFTCNPIPRTFYLVSTVILGGFTLWATLDSAFQAPRLRPMRAALFSALGLWGLAPCAHQLILHWGEPAVARAVAHYAVMGSLYLGGAAIFAARIPERWAPGRFDLVGNSHQIFHVAIVAAAAVHYRGVMGIMHWRDSVGGCPA